MSDRFGDAKQRKETPMSRGVVDYFPDALAAVARLSFKANEKHNPGQPMHWSQEKSSDHGDCIVRHQAEREEVDPETGEQYYVHVAWRALAQAQIYIQAKRAGLSYDAYVEKLQKGEAPMLGKVTGLYELGREYPWRGGENPVPGCMVDYRMANEPSYWNTNAMADSLYWDHRVPTAGNIIAFRVVHR